MIELLPITSGLYAGLATILIVGLAYRVSLARRKFQVGLGEGESENKAAMQSVIRAHANAVENVPLAITLLALSELVGLHPIALHIAGITILASRLLHALGLSQSSGVSKGRYYGTLLCWLTMILLAIYLIANYVLKVF